LKLPFSNEGGPGSRATGSLEGRLYNQTVVSGGAIWSVLLSCGSFSQRFQ
jgi:hypothetical protein